MFINKIVLPFGLVNNSSNFIAVAILYEEGKLAYCKNGDQSWTFMRYDGVRYLWLLGHYILQGAILCCDSVNMDENIALCNFNDESPSVSELSVSKIIRVFPK